MTQPFGKLDQEVTPFHFDGTPEELENKLQNSWTTTVPPRKKKKKKVSKTAAKPIKPKGVVKKKATSITPGFDRNRGGGTPAEHRAAQHIITNVVRVAPEVERDYVARLQTLTRSLTRFLVVEVAAFESAWTNALEDAGESIRILTGVQVADMQAGRAAAVIAKIPELKTIDYICEQLAVPADIRTALIAEYLGTDNGKKQFDLQRLLALASKANNTATTTRTIKPTPRPPPQTRGNSRSTTVPERKRR